MAQFLQVHPDNPQARLLKQAVSVLTRGGVVAVPTDSSYALVCHLDDKSAVDRMRRIRQVDERHHLTLLCRDLSELANYARVDNRQYRLLKAATPGAYTGACALEPTTVVDLTPMDRGDEPELVRAGRGPLDVLGL